MTEYQKEKVRDLISAMEPEEKELAFEILLKEKGLKIKKPSLEIHNEKRG